MASLVVKNTGIFLFLALGVISQSARAQTTSPTGHREQNGPFGRPPDAQGTARAALETVAETESPEDAPPESPAPKKTKTKKGARAFRVVIDPGHGGTDFGTVAESGGHRYSEKMLTLLLAHQAAAEMRARGMTVFLTRDEDEDIELGPRTHMANRLKADIFISIHMNSTLTPMVTDAEGIETYILNNTSEASSRSLARLENSVLNPEDRQGDPDQLDVALILRDLRLDANLSESKRLACNLLPQLVAAGNRPSALAGYPGFSGRKFKTRDRGVKQALFHVLLGAEMPSVLVEAGFLSNPRDRNMILDPRTRKTLGVAFARAVENFRDTKNTARASETLSRCKVH